MDLAKTKELPEDRESFFQLIMSHPEIYDDIRSLAIKILESQKGEG